MSNDRVPVPSGADTWVLAAEAIRAAVAESLGLLADKSSRAARRIQAENENDAVAAYVARLADVAHQASAYVGGTDVPVLLGDLKERLRAKPLVALGGALAGLAITQLAASCMSETPGPADDDRQERAQQNGSVGHGAPATLGS